MADEEVGSKPVTFITGCVGQFAVRMHASSSAGWRPGALAQAPSAVSEEEQPWCCGAAGAQERVFSSVGPRSTMYVDEDKMKHVLL